MDLPLHADIFYVVTTIAIAIVAIGIAVILAYVIPLVRDLKKMTHKALEESDKVIADVDMMRHKIRNEVMQAGSLLDLVRSFFGRRRKRRIQTQE